MIVCFVSIKFNTVFEYLCNIFTNSNYLFFVFFFFQQHKLKAKIQAYLRWDTS